MKNRKFSLIIVFLLLGLFLLSGCAGGVIGSNMDVKDGRMPEPNATIHAENFNGRKFTSQEMFGHLVAFSTFYGSGERQFPMAEMRANIDAWSGCQWEYIAGHPNCTDSVAGGWLSRNFPDIAEEIDGEPSRHVGRWFGGVLIDLVANVFLFIANGISSLTSSVVTSLFNPNFICNDPSCPIGPGGVDTCSRCINLLYIIAGDTPGNMTLGNIQEAGIIGLLTASLYLPLLVLAGIITGAWVVWKGIIRRESRETFVGLFWTVCVTILGLAFLLNPVLLARAPMAINNAIGGVILEAINNPDNAANPACVSRWGIPVAPDEQLVFHANGLSCQIWHSFVVNTWVNGQFGGNWNSLNSDLTGEPGIWRIPMQLDTVALSTTGRDTFRIGDWCPTQHNTALFHLWIRSGYLRDDHPVTFSDAGLNGINPQGFPENDARWAWTINEVYENEAMWRSWAPLGANNIGRIGHSFLGMFSTLIAGASLMFFSVFGLVYYVSAVVLMTFAPLFLLLAVHPGKGRKMFLGWLEQVVGSILKYMATALFVLVALFLYAGILANTSPMTGLIGIIVMVIVLVSYRKEFVNIMGKIDMGGTQMSSNLGKKLGNMGKKTAAFAGGVAAGAVGSKMAGGTLRQGMADGAGRELRKGNGLVGNTAKMYNQTKRKKEGEFEKHKREQVAADRHEDLKTSVHDRIDKTDDAVFGQKNQETGERSGGLQSQVQSHDTRLSDHDTQLTSHNQRITNNANRISVNQTKQDKMQNNLTQVNKTQKQHGQRINNVETDTKDLYDHATKPDDKV